MDMCYALNEAIGNVSGLMESVFLSPMYWRSEQDDFDLLLIENLMSSVYSELKREIEDSIEDV
jgi:hypothetical protein